MQKRISLLILLLIIISNFPTLFNLGLFWDDWTIYKASISILEQQFKGIGLWNSGYPLLHYVFLRNTFGIFIYRFVSSIIFPILVFFFIYRISFFYLGTKNYKDLVYIPLFSIVLPFFAARNTLICFTYVIGLIEFLLAWMLYVEYRKNKRIILLIFSLIFFTHSFFVQSLVPFYGVFLLLNLFSLRKEGDKSVLKIEEFKHWVILLLPIVFFSLIKIFLIETTGYYALEEYNKITIESPGEMILKFYIATKSIISTLLLKFEEVISSFKLFNLIVVFTIFTIISWQLVRLIAKQCSESIRKITRRPELVILIIGIVATILGWLPYILVNKPPNYSGYETRHQLLLFFGPSIIIYYLIVFLNNPVKRILVTLIISFCLVFNFALNLRYTQGWFTLSSIGHGFIENKERIAGINTIEIDDTDVNFFATDRKALSYEYRGLYGQSMNRNNQSFLVKIGEAKRITENFESIGSYMEYLKRINSDEAFLLGDYLPNNHCINIKIIPGEVNLLRDMNFLVKNSLLGFINSEAFIDNISVLYHFEIKECEWLTEEYY